MNETEYYKNGPSEWNYKKLGDVVTFQGGSQPAKKYFSNDKSEGMIRLIQIRDYKNDNFITYVPKELCRRFCDVDDIMIGRYGPPIFQILRGIEGAYNVALIKAIPNEEIINKNYLYYFIKNEHLFKLIDGLSQRTSGQTGIDMDVLKKYIIPIPNLTEQEKIAEILSTVDEQIENTEKLIQKNQELKKGLMQQLLTKGIGHTEFKKTEIGSVPIEWEIKNLEYLVEIRNGNSPSNFTLNETGKYPFFKVDDMNYTNKYLNKAKVYFDDCKYSLMTKGMIVFPKRGASIFTNKIAILNLNGYFDTNIMGLKCKDELINEYLFYYLKFIGLERFADTTAVPQINNKHINPLKIPIPSIVEQEKIVWGLDQIDGKIEQYKNKKENLEDLKGGLMQDLLLGKIRVI